MLVNKITDAIKFLEENKSISLDELRGDRRLQGSILWYLYVAIQGSIDLGLRIISKLGLRTPESYVDVFEVLRESNLIPKKLAEKLVEMAKFRHVLSHAYTRVDLEIVLEILQRHLSDIREFLKILETRLKEYRIDLTKL